MRKVRKVCTIVSCELLIAILLDCPKNDSRVLEGWADLVMVGAHEDVEFIGSENGRLIRG